MVVEGYVDVLTLHQGGFRYVVSPMATALTPDHLAVVRQLTERVTLLFDGDAAGQRAPLSAMSPAAVTKRRISINPITPKRIVSPLTRQFVFITDSQARGSLECVLQSQLQLPHSPGPGDDAERGRAPGIGTG